HTRSTRDWSSDVCSSDLHGECEKRNTVPARRRLLLATLGFLSLLDQLAYALAALLTALATDLLVELVTALFGDLLPALATRLLEIGRASCRERAHAPRAA